jgi:hypothetical protein
MQRVLLQALKEPEEESDGDAEDEARAFRILAGRKLKKCRAFLGDESCARSLAIASVGTAPLDKLSSRLQHLDSVGSACAELSMPRGVLYTCQTHLWSLLNDWSLMRHSDKWQVVVSHLGDAATLQQESRLALLSISGHVWSRLELRYGGWPWRHFYRSLVKLPSQLPQRSMRCCLDRSTAWVISYYNILGDIS